VTKREFKNKRTKEIIKGVEKNITFKEFLKK